MKTKIGPAPLNASPTPESHATILFPKTQGAAVKDTDWTYEEQAILEGILATELHRPGGFTEKQDVAHQMADKIRDAFPDQEDLAGKIDICNRDGKLHILPHRRYVETFRCHQSRLCPYCARQRANRLALAYEAAIGDLSRQYRIQFITLTVPNAKPGEYAETMKMIWTSWGLLRRRVAWKTAVAGSLVAAETTWNTDSETFHPHLHILAVVRPPWEADMDWGAIQADWEDITGAPGVNMQIVTHRPAENAKEVQGAVAELLKYLAKFKASAGDTASSGGMLDMPREAFQEWFQAHRRGALSRRVRSYGVLNGIGKDEEEGDQQEREDPKVEALASFYFRTPQRSGEKTEEGAPAAENGLGVFLIPRPNSTDLDPAKERMGLPHLEALVLVIQAILASAAHKPAQRHAIRAYVTKKMPSIMALVAGVEALQRSA